MRYLNVFSVEEFPIEGKLKKYWNKIGMIKITQKGNTFLKLFQHPNVSYPCFEDKGRDFEKARYQPGVGEK